MKARISVQERRYSVHKMGRERLDSGGGMIGLLERPNIKPPNFDTESDLEPLSNQTHSIQLPQISEGLDSSAPGEVGGEGGVGGGRGGGSCVCVGREE